MIQYLENGGKLYIESVDIGLSHDNTAFIDYLGLMFLNDGGDNEVTKIASGDEGILSNMTFYYLGGEDAHYSLDRLESNYGSSLAFSSDDGYGRMFVNDNNAYKTIASSVMLGGMANGDSLNIRPYLVSEMMNFFIGYNPITSITENKTRQFSSTNAPNPFRERTEIEFITGKSAFVSIQIFNAQGQIVKHLLSTEVKPGTHVVPWDATNDQGEFVKAGYYFYRISTGDYSLTEKMILLR